MRQFGLIGYPLGHSFSGRYFAEKFAREKIRDTRYDLFPIPAISEFPRLLSDTRNLVGLNVTIPYKESVIPFLDRLDEKAAVIGAVNTIRVEKDGSTMGFNTDADGFWMSVAPMLQGRKKQALILGSGGASKAVRFALESYGFTCITISRKPQNGLAYGQITTALLNDTGLIVNCTPLGTHPHTTACPAIPYGGIDSRHLAMDLVYNPPETVFLKKARAQGAAILNGERMLHAQAEKSWEIWNK